MNQEDIGKDIYFLGNKYYDTNKEKCNKCNDILNKLNNNITEILIDGNNYENKKYFKPKEAKEYNIKLKFKNKLKDCSYMFSGCENIITINLNDFNTKYVTKMKRMFNGCINLKYINLIYKFIIINNIKCNRYVRNVSKMFKVN